MSKSFLFFLFLFFNCGKGRGLYTDQFCVRKLWWFNFLWRIVDTTFRLNQFKCTHHTVCIWLHSFEDSTDKYSLKKKEKKKERGKKKKALCIVVEPSEVKFWLSFDGYPYSCRNQNGNLQCLVTCLQCLVGYRYENCSCVTLMLYWWLF